MELIEIHQPRAVVFVGLGQREQIVQLYGLTDRADEFEKVSGQYVIQLHRDHHGRPWVFTKHFSARLKRAELDAMAGFMLKRFPSARQIQ